MRQHASRIVACVVSAGVLLVGKIRLTTTHPGCDVKVLRLDFLTGANHLV